jgi:hypothetical protein
LIPGNHDVSWPHSIRSMEKLNSIEQNYKDLWKNPQNNIRWSWKDLSFYKISNEGVYNERFAPFSRFYSDFYENQRKYSLNPKEQFDIFEFPEYNIIFFGLNSCYCNDHLNDFGLINQDCMVSCHEIITKEKKYEDWLKIAVWHHGTYGAPSRSDYLDQGTIQFLIDKGFHIGLHGHQHTSEIVDMKFIIDQSLQMPLLGCGTLCASYHDIPLGETRQYNIIELNRYHSHLTLHIRKAHDPAPGLSIWMPESIKQNNGEKFMTIPFGKINIIYSDEKDREYMVNKPVPSRELSEVDNLLTNKNYKQALAKLKLLDNKNPIVQRLLLECLSNLELDDELIEFIKEPKDVREFTYLTDALWRKGDVSYIKRILNISQKNEEITTSESYSRMSKKIKDRD